MREEKNAPEAEQAPAAKPPGKSKVVMILMIVNTVIVLGVGGFLVYTNVLGGSDASAANAEEKPEANEEETKPTNYVALDSFVVNLNEPGAPRYLKLTFSVEVRGSDNAAEKIAERTAPIRDRVLTYLSGLRLSEVQGRDSKNVIKQRLVETLRETVPGDVVQNVLFMEFVVQ